MKTFTTVRALREALAEVKRADIGFVPTMGALHAGHRSLVEKARKECKVVVVSVFVNPTQFNDKNDLRNYPRTPEADAALLEAAGADFVLMPSVEEIYPEPDTRIFDFVKFMEEYSLIIYPVFLWYAYSAQMGTESIFTLNDFRATVRLGYLDIKENGRSTLEWLRGNVESRLRSLRQNYPKMQQPVEDFGRYLRDSKDVVPEQTYLYMHGHTLMDNVVMVLLTDVCDQLRKLSQARISASSKEGIALRDEMSNYNNSLRSIRDVLLDNENYTSCPLYKRLSLDIEHYLQHTICQMQRNCE